MSDQRVAAGVVIASTLLAAGLVYAYRKEIGSKLQQVSQKVFGKAVKPTPQPAPLPPVTVTPPPVPTPIPQRGFPVIT